METLQLETCPRNCFALGRFWGESTTQFSRLNSPCEVFTDCILSRKKCKHEDTYI